MTRPTISDDFGGQRLQTQARPVTPTVQAAPLVEDRRWEKLARVFDAGGVLIEQQQKQQREEETANAQRWAQSMTVEELGKAIKDGKMLPSQSPVFAATVQHIWGQNTQAQIERDTLSKVTTGELKFASPQEIDTYLVEARNTALAGQSKFAVAGFDKTHAALRDKLMDAVARTTDKEIVQAAEMQASDALSNTLLKVTSKDFAGTPDDAARTILEQYQLLRKTRVMNDQSARAALGDVITRAASSGKTTLLASLLNQELPGIGTVRGFLGETKAATLQAQATSTFDQAQRQRIDDELLPFYQAAHTGTLSPEKFTAWATAEDNKKYVSSATIHSLTRANAAALADQQRELQRAQLQGQAQASEYEARKRVDAALAEGRLWEVQGTNTPKVFTSSGAVTDFNVREYAEQALKARTAKLPFHQQVSAWAMNGLENPDWKAQLQAGFLNLASIGVGSDGKPAGVLNEAGKAAIDLFKQLDTVSPDAAKQTAGDGAYKRFSDIAFLTHLGRDVNDAASIASNAARGAEVGSATDKLAKAVHAAVADLTESTWTDWLKNKGGALQDFGADLQTFARMSSPVARAGLIKEGVEQGGWGGAGKALTGLLWFAPPGEREASHVMRNTTPNTAQVTGMVKRYATLLAHSGQVGDADAAVKLAVQYIERPEVSAKVNGTLYLRSEMPAAPSASRTQTEWLERFIDEVPKARAKELGYAGSEVRLEYDERARLYRAFVRGLPMTDPEGGIMMFPRTHIEQWYASREKQDLIEAAKTGGPKKSPWAFGPAITYKPAEGAPGIYAPPAEWEAYRAEQARKTKPTK